MAIDSVPNETKSRRAILVGAAGGLAALIAGRFASPDRANAAAGDPMIIGSSANNAGTANTALTTASSGTALLVTQNGGGTALRGSAVGAGSIAGFFTASNGTGISGVTSAAGSYGVFGQNNGAAGSAGAIRASGGQNHGLVASTANNSRYAVEAIGANGTAVYASATQIGVEGVGYRGVVGSVGTASFAAAGVYGSGGTGADNYGVLGDVDNATGRGVYGVNHADSTTSYGVFGQSDATSNGASGVKGIDAGGTAYTNGVIGQSTSTGGTGVWGDTTEDSSIAYSVYGTAVGAGRAVVGDNATAGGYALYGFGDGAVTGAFSKASGTFKIDHPLDPANKYLLHSFVESPDMMNVYNGMAKLGPDGTATVKLADWFEALNGDFRYQLTAIGAAAPNLHVSSFVKDNAFSIAGGEAGQSVSWLVTGIRQDAWAKAHRVEVEVAKTGREKGKYLHPKEHGQPKSKGIAAKARA